jgi:hypothetical protein
VRTSHSQLRRRLLKSKDSCHYCNKKLCIKTATLEHKIPKSLGGKDNISNLALACTECNSALGGILGSIKMLRRAELQIEKEKFRRSFIGRLIHVFRPDYSFNMLNSLEKQSKKIHHELHIQMVRFKNYKCFYSKYINESNL